MDPFERREAFEDPGEATMTARPAVRLGHRARNEKEHGLRGGRAIPLEEAIPESCHLGAAVGLEEDVVPFSGESDRGPLLERAAKFPVGVPKHLRDCRLAHEPGLHELPKATRTSGGAGLLHRPAAGLHRVDLKRAHRFRGARRARAQPFGERGNRSSGAEHGVQIEPFRRGEEDFCGIDEVDAEVGEERDAVGTCEARGPEERGRAEGVADLAEGAHEREAIRPEGTRVPEDNQLRTTLPRGS
jgi:hypothetical protein